VNPIVTEILQEIFQSITIAIILLLASIITLYINKLRRKTEEIIGNESLKILDDIIYNVVKSINQTVCEKTKEKNRALSGKPKLSAKQEKAVKNLAKEQINFIVSDKVIKDIKSVVCNVDKYIDHTIESTIKSEKNE